MGKDGRAEGRVTFTVRKQAPVKEARLELRVENVDGRVFAVRQLKVTIE